MGVTLTETPLMFPIVLVTTLVSTKAFCDGPIPLLRFFEHGQDIGVRTALCSINRSIALPPAPTYLLLIAVTLATSLFGFSRLERAPALPRSSEQWRRVWELSLVVIVSATFFYGHYYYLAVLILPLNAVMARLTGRSTRKRPLLALWGLAYLLLAAFLLPPSYLGRLVGTDVWRLYFTSVAYFPGELILLGLVLHEYATLPLASQTDLTGDQPIDRHAPRATTRYAAMP